MMHQSRGWLAAPLVILAALTQTGCGESPTPAVAESPAPKVPTAYEKEEWAPGRQLVWAQPGVKGDFNVAANWTENGYPATTPPDRNTDIVLPTSKDMYLVQATRLDQVRHVTVEKKATLTGGHRDELEIWGNVHVHEAGRIRFISIVGDKHTFFKIDNAPFPTAGNKIKFQHPTRALPYKEQSLAQISHKFQIAKYGTASVEFLGNAGASDEVMLQHGKMIVSGDFRFSGVTGKGAFEIYDGGILEIQSGGRIGPFDPDNAKSVYNFNIYRNGTIQAGSPERPLTSDAYLLLGFAENDQPGRTGLYSALGSMMRVYSADPQKARLVVSATASVPDFHDGLGRLIGNPDVKASGKLGTALQLAGDVQLDGVHFDYLSAGGLALRDPEMMKSWKNVTYGPHCAGPLDQLVGVMSADPNAYYHARLDMVGEYKLTVRAMDSMSKFQEAADPFRLETTPATSKMQRVERGNASMETPVAVVFEQPITVEVNTRVPGATIRYTTDGTEPVKASPLYEGPIQLNKTTKLMVKAYKQGVGFSPTFSTTYVFK